MSINLTGSNETVEATDALARAGNDEDQMSRPKLLFAWSGSASAMFFVYIGAALGVAYGTTSALIGIVLTIITYGVINALLSKYSINNRSTVALFSRTILGRTGSAIATAIFALVAIYYSVFEGSIVAVALQAQFGGQLWFWSLIVVLYTTPLIVGGARRFLDKINGVLLPVYFFGLIAAVIWAGVKFDGLHVAPPVPAIPVGQGGPGWLAVYASYMGIWIMMMYTMDYAALGRRDDTKFHQWVTFGPIFYVLAYGFSGIVGIVLVSSIPGFEASEGGVAVGIVNMMGIIGLIVIVASQTRMNTANYYLGTANLADLARRVLKIKAPNIVFVILNSVLVYLLMLLPVLQYILLALAWQGVLVTGWVAIAVTHVLLTKRQEHGQIDDVHYRRGNPAGLTAWIIATIVGLLMLQLKYVNPDLAGIGSIWGPIVTAVLASGVYAVMMLTTKHKTALITAG
ncbi:purine-cytosine permease family protein [Pseudoclavibacter sp. CFCC 11306]|uniref:purine-cytosine permease family protein n=1 Tax=Pseudoclavibacter sp. CFCC 11306 TaxID=1564493 RepID=UPI00130194CA|nr:permease [Pseudoclavibacter sp. CFCC 11306]KAB1658857.1 permease [Pseudoclavibacter sp. CFCC 11306]